MEKKRDLSLKVIEEEVKYDDVVVIPVPTHTMDGTRPNDGHQQIIEVVANSTVDGEQIPSPLTPTLTHRVSSEEDTSQDTEPIISNLQDGLEEPYRRRDTSRYSSTLSLSEFGVGAVVSGDEVDDDEQDGSTPFTPANVSTVDDHRNVGEAKSSEETERHSSALPRVDEEVEDVSQRTEPSSNHTVLLEDSRESGIANSGDATVPPTQVVVAEPEDEPEAIAPLEPVFNSIASSSSGGTSIPVKKRRRGSISISRVGVLHELTPLLVGNCACAHPDGTRVSTTSPTPWAQSAPSGVYRAMASSASSLASSSASFSTPYAHANHHTHGTDDAEDVDEDDPLAWHTTQKETIGRRGTTLSRSVSAIGRQLARVRSWGDGGLSSVMNGGRRGTRSVSGAYDGGAMSLRAAFGLGGSLSSRGSVPVVQVMPDPMAPEGAVVIGVAVEEERVEVEASPCECEWGAPDGEGSRRTSTVGHASVSMGASGISLPSVTSHVSVAATSTTIGKAKGRRRASTSAGTFFKSVVTASSRNADIGSSRSAPPSPNPDTTPPSTHETKLASTETPSPMTPTPITLVSGARFSPQSTSPTTTRTPISVANTNAGTNSSLARIAKVFAQNLKLRRKSAAQTNPPDISLNLPPAPSTSRSLA